MSAVRALLDRWRSATHGPETVRTVLARGDVPFAVEGRAAAELTLFRCMEQLADAMQADAFDAALPPALDHLGVEVDEPSVGDELEAGVFGDGGVA